MVKSAEDQSESLTRNISRWFFHFIPSSVRQQRGCYYGCVRLLHCEVNSETAGHQLCLSGWVVKLSDKPSQFQTTELTDIDLVNYNWFTCLPLCPGLTVDLEDCFSSLDKTDIWDSGVSSFNFPWQNPYTNDLPKSSEVHFYWNIIR